MTIVNSIRSVSEASGLALINLTTFLGASTKITQPYGFHPRQVLDWYRGKGKDRPLVIFFVGETGRRGGILSIVLWPIRDWISDVMLLFLTIVSSLRLDLEKLLPTQELPLTAFLDKETSGFL